LQPPGSVDRAVDPSPTEAQPQTCYRHPDRKAGVRCQRCERLICPSCMSTASVGFHCPECARSGKQKVYTRANMSVLNRPLVTQVLVGINAVVFGAGLVDRRDDAFAGRGGFALDGGLFGPAVADGEWYRIITAGFLHGGLIHVLFNMMALFTLGSVLEPAIGRLRFGLAYGVSLLCGSLGVLLLDPNALTVGASGAVFGLMGVLVVAQRVRGIDPWSSGLGMWLGLNLLITFAIPGISIGGHLGGLAGGLVSGWVLLEAGPKAWPKQPWVPVAAVASIGVIAFGACLVVA
jgi:membrane associated rhomboid family serine protease